jgi:hypothetical protein
MINKLVTFGGTRYCESLPGILIGIEFSFIIKVYL